MTEWGPWIEHDGTGCPAEIMPGVRMECEYRDGKVGGGKVNVHVVVADNWFWPKANGRIFPTDCMRYRIRKPRGLANLEELLTSLPELVGEDA